MMKRIALAAAVVATALPALAHGNERGAAKATVAGKAITVDYGRPMLKGRDMLGQAEVGKPWRMGADAATTLKTEADLLFGEVALPKGEYVLTATKLADDKWQLSLALASDHSKVSAVPLTFSRLDASVETFTIELAGDAAHGEFTMKWGTTALKAGFSGK